MLRITALNPTPALVTLTVEGRIVGEWVHVLERECLAHTREGLPVRLDFTGVSTVDCDGVAMLQRLAPSGVEIVNPSPYVRALLGEEEPCA